METGGAKRKSDHILEENQAINVGAGETTKDKKARNNNDDKLERYLKEIYTKYCRFSVSEKETAFIRNGVEKLTLEYLEKTYRCSPCEDKSCKIINCGQLELVKAGSFYEGTRNRFPDEFDFIAVLGRVNEEPDENTFSHLFGKGFCTDCEVYKSDEFPGYSIRFLFTFGCRAHGSATRLEYIYKRENEEITIDVDIVTALRCCNVEQYYMVDGIFNKNFYNEMLKTGSFLFVYTGSSSSTSEVGQSADDTGKNRHISGPWDKSVTETETRFVRDILCGAHKKVYRLLKYLINGPFGENLFRYMDEGVHSPMFMMLGHSFHISSYIIKIAVIHHHYACEHNLYKIGDCVIDVLYYIIQTAYNQNYPRFISMHTFLYRNKVGPSIGLGNYYFLSNFYWCFMAFTKRLRSLKSTDDELVKCCHDLEDSFLEMALRLDIFAEHEAKLIRIERIFSNKSILWPFSINLKTLVKKVKEYNEKRKQVPDCPWCDYPIFIMANKRKL